MDDTISREAAIKAIGGIAWLIPEARLVACDKIRALPSAEPRWIPVSERLPEPNQMVLISINGEVDADWIAVDNTGYKSWYRCMRDVTSVDAWMPLPEPWKGEEDG